jgi:hypothetical protein
MLHFGKPHRMASSFQTRLVDEYLRYFVEHVTAAAVRRMDMERFHVDG